MNLKFWLLFSTAVVLISAAPSSLIVKRKVDPSLIPEFGLIAGINPIASDCDGIQNAKGEVVKVPCSCPPTREDFIAALNANVAAGHAVNNPNVLVSFPTGNDRSSKLSRMMAAIITLQNLHDRGVGCPASSTSFSAQLQAILEGTDTPPSSSHSTEPSPSLLPSPASTPTPPFPSPSFSSRPVQPTPSLKSSLDGVDRNLVPEFGHEPGQNPTGTGDCDGIPNPAGQPIKVPCICPPDKEDFIQSLSANVAVGHAVNNTNIKVSFPTGDDKLSKLSRINAAIITLQNLRGAGIGCPTSSTTFVAQRNAIQNS